MARVSGDTASCKLGSYAQGVPRHCQGFTKPRRQLVSLLVEILTNPVNWLIFAIYAGVAVWERVAPGRSLPALAGWRFKGLAFFTGYVVLSNVFPRLWDPLLAPYQLLDLTGLGTWGGTLVGLLVYEVVAWCYHRALHTFEPLWRVHQTHHSAERLDVASAFMFHPLDVAGWNAVGSLALTIGVGVSPAAITNILLITYLLATFQHANVRTPRWLGYLVQRPEAHTVHHARAIHHKNYADLPVIDMIFGTFENPTSFEHETGFFLGASSKHWHLFSLRDVARERRDASS